MVRQDSLGDSDHEKCVQELEVRWLRLEGYRSHGSVTIVMPRGRTLACIRNCKNLITIFAKQLFIFFVFSFPLPGYPTIEHGQRLMFAITILYTDTSKLCHEALKFRRPSRCLNHLGVVKELSCQFCRGNSGW